MSQELAEERRFGRPIYQRLQLFCTSLIKEGGGRRRQFRQKERPFAILFPLLTSGMNNEETGS